MSKPSKFALQKKELKISEENALEQLMLLLERYDIDINEKEGKVKEAFEGTLKNVLKSITKGFIEIFEEDGQIKVRQIIEHRAEGSTIHELVYCELKMSDHTAMRGGEDVTQYDKMVDLLGVMCETPGGDIAISMLKSSDASRAQHLVLLFL